jgi:aminoglycoside phosphotransferase (APT) family kinase protein
MQSTTTITDSLVQQVWKALNLGPIEQIDKPKRGSINPCFIINDAKVIRFNTNTDKGADRFESEAAAYERLKGSEVPVPQVIKVDVTRKIVPFTYLITSKINGETVIDSWTTLNPTQQQQIAFSAGKYLALIHQHTYPKFGNLRDLPDGGFEHWHDYVWDFFRRYARQALALKAINTKLEARIHAVLLHHKPTLDTMTTGALVHSDYHFENMLQSNGEITGIIDFEWAYSGDPSQDFIVDEKWEEMCAGSREHVLKGYASLRKLDDHHELRLMIYKALWHLETVVDFKKAKRDDDYQSTLKQLSETVESLEAQP